MRVTTFALLLAWMLSSGAGSSMADESPSGEPQEEQEQPEEEKPKPGFYWDRGLHFRGPTGWLQFKVGGVVQNDTTGFISNEDVETALGSLDSGVQWRRARAYIQGTFSNHLEYKFMYDFAVRNPPNLKDAYIGVVNLPFFIPLLPLDIRAGRFRAPLSLEGYTGANNTTFLERALITTFLPSRNTGVMFHGNSPENFLRWNVAFVQEEDNFGIDFSRNPSITARFAAAFRPKGFLLHVGGDYVRRVAEEDGTFRFVERPESHLAPQFVDTGDFLAERMDMGILEGAVRKGPLSIQGEYVRSFISSEETGDPQFYSFYVYASYFLTGESRPYDTERGSFGRPDPTRVLRDGSGGIGALEVAFRFSRVDLTDQGVDGGVLNDWTAAFNWYPSPETRVMFNAILADRQGAKSVGIFQIRVQFAL